jgi:hypothetical protein
LPLFQLDIGRKYPQTREYTSVFSPHLAIIQLLFLRQILQLYFGMAVDDTLLFCVKSPQLHGVFFFAAIIVELSKIA